MIAKLFPDLFQLARQFGQDSRNKQKGARWCDHPFYNIHKRYGSPRFVLRNQSRRNASGGSPGADRPADGNWVVFIEKRAATPSSLLSPELAAVVSGL